MFLESKQHAVRPNDTKLIIKDSEDQKVGASTLVTDSTVITAINFTVGSNNNPNLKAGRGGSNRGRGKSKNINHSPCVSQDKQLSPLEKEKKNSLARVWKLQMWAKSFQVEVRDPEQHLGLLTRAWGRIH